MKEERGRSIALFLFFFMWVIIEEKQEGGLYMIVDVSVHNGAINWVTAKAAGVEAALIRCGYGRDFAKYDDPRFKANIAAFATSSFSTTIC